MESWKTDAYVLYDLQPLSLVFMLQPTAKFRYKSAESYDGSSLRLMPCSLQTVYSPSVLGISFILANLSNCMIKLHLSIAGPFPKSSVLLCSEKVQN
jgi:hypothetical protein